MNIIQLVKLYLLTAVTFFAIDFVWLAYVAPKFYEKHVGPLLADDVRKVPQLELIWGPRGFYIPFQYDTDAGVKLVHKTLLDAGVAQTGDRIVITAGMPLPAMGRSNMVHVSQL